MLLQSCVAAANDCLLTSAGLEYSLEGLTGVVFRGFNPQVTRVEGAPMLTVLAYGSEPELKVVDGKLVVAKATCTAAPPTTASPNGDGTSNAPFSLPSVSPTAGPDKGVVEISGTPSFLPPTSGLIPSITIGLALWLSGVSSAHGAFSSVTLMSFATSIPTGRAQIVDCDSEIEVSLCSVVRFSFISSMWMQKVVISGPVRSVGAVWMEEEIDWVSLSLLVDYARPSMHASSVRCLG